jgi:hypothetical protein
LILTESWPASLRAIIGDEKANELGEVAMTEAGLHDRSVEELLYLSECFDYLAFVAARDEEEIARTGITPPERGNLIFFAESENPDGLDRVRMGLDALERAVAILNSVEGYNKARAQREGDHEAVIDFFEEHIEYLKSFIEGRDTNFGGVESAE